MHKEEGKTTMFDIFVIEVSVSFNFMSLWKARKNK